MDSLKRHLTSHSNQSIRSQELNDCMKEFIDNMLTQIDSNQKTNRVFSFSDKWKDINSQSIATIDGNTSQDVKTSTEEVIARSEASSDSTPKTCLESKAVCVVPSVPNIELLIKSFEDQNYDKNEESVELKIERIEDLNRFVAKFVCSQTVVVLAEDVELLKELELKRYELNQNIESNEEMAKRETILIGSQLIEEVIVSVPDIEEVIDSVPDIENITDDNRIDQLLGSQQNVIHLKLEDRFSEITDQTNEDFNDSTLYDSVVPQMEDKMLPIIDTTYESSNDSSEAEVPEEEEMILTSNVVYGIEPIQLPRFRRMPLKVGLNRKSLKRGQHLLKY